jgi:hypothetical protein
MRSTYLVAFAATFLSLALGTPSFAAGVAPATDGACSPPCLLINCTAPNAACGGDAITFDVKAFNCSLDNEDITVIMPNGQSPTQTVAPNGAFHFIYTDIMPACTPGGGVNFLFVAQAVNPCGQTTAATAAVAVACNCPTPNKPSSWGALKVHYR